VLATGLPCFASCYRLVLLRGCFWLLLLTVALNTSLCCAWEQFANSNGRAPKLADGQGIAAVPVLLHWTCRNSSESLCGRDCELWIRYIPERTVVCV